MAEPSPINVPRIELSYIGDEERSTVDETPAPPSDVSTAGSETPAVTVQVLPRRLGVMSVAFLAFFTVCAGPFGIEAAVRGGGPLMVLIAIVVLGVVWAAPQALMTAELSCLMDVNGGYIEWVSRAMGPFPSWVAAFNSLGSNFVDLPLYPVMFAAYFEPLLAQWTGHTPDWWVMLIVKFVCLSILVFMNLRGIQDVSRAASLITIIILTPFAIEAVMASNHLNPRAWKEVARPISWSPYISTLLWNLQGFDHAGSVAGEVKNPQRSYGLGLLISVCLIAVTYFVPVLVGTSVDPDYKEWHVGTLAVVAGKVAPWLGVWVGLGAMLAQLGNGLAIMAASARCTWQMSHKKMMPKFLGTLWNKYNSPAAAVILHTATTCGLMLLPFTTLIMIDTLFNNLALVFKTLSFLVLRYTEPHTYRPFVVPGGIVVAWMVTLSKLGVIAFAVAMVSRTAWLVVGSANVLFITSYFVVKAMRKGEEPPPEVTETSHLKEFVARQLRALPSSIRHPLGISSPEGSVRSEDDEEIPVEFEDLEADDDDGERSMPVENNGMSPKRVDVTPFLRTDARRWDSRPLRGSRSSGGSRGSRSSRPLGSPPSPGALEDFSVAVPARSNSYQDVIPAPSPRYRNTDGSDDGPAPLDDETMTPGI